MWEKILVLKILDVTSYLYLAPSVGGEVYCFPRRQLIFSFDRLKYIYIIWYIYISFDCIYHLKGLWEYIPK